MSRSEMPHDKVGRMTFGGIMASWGIAMKPALRGALLVGGAAALWNATGPLWGQWARTGGRDGVVVVTKIGITRRVGADGHAVPHGLINRSRRHPVRIEVHAGHVRGGGKRLAHRSSSRLSANERSGLLATLPMRTPNQRHRSA